MRIKKMTGWSRLWILVAVALSIVLSIVVSQSTNASSPEPVLAAPQTTTTNGVNVTVDSVEKSADRVFVSIHHQADAGLNAFPIGASLLTLSDGSLVRAESGFADATGETAMNGEVEVYPVVLGDRSITSVNIGSYVVFDGRVGRSSVAIDQSGEVVAVSDGSFTVGDAQFEVVSITASANGGSTYIRVEPRNASAAKLELAAGPSKLTVSDDTGNSYTWRATRTSWDLDGDAQHVNFQVFYIDGEIDGNATSIDLRLQGAGTITGPVVFDLAG